MPCAPRQLRLVPQAVISLHARGTDPQALGSVDNDDGLCPKPAYLEAAWIFGKRAFETDYCASLPGTAILAFKPRENPGECRIRAPLDLRRRNPLSLKQPSAKRTVDQQGTVSSCAAALSSRPEDSPLRALPDPYVNLSIHTAPDVRPFPWQSCQWAKSVGFTRRSQSNQSRAPLVLRRNRLNLPRAQRMTCWTAWLSLESGGDPTSGADRNSLLAKSGRTAFPRTREPAH